MARAAWAISGLCGVAAIGLAVSNAGLRADNDALTEQLEDARSEITALQRIKERGGKRTQRGRPDRQPPPDREDRSHEDMLAEIPAEEILDTPGLEHELNAAIDERVKEEIGNRRTAWMEARKQEMEAGIATFSEDMNLDDETRDELTAVTDDAMEDAANIMRARREGHSSYEKANEDMLAIRDTYYTDLVDLLGEDDAASFFETLHGPLKGPPGQ